MQDSSKGTMFLAGERTHTETEWFRSYATFNSGNDRNDNKAAFGSLYVLNDDTLAPGKSVRLECERNTHIVLLPVVGALTYKDKYNHTGTVEVGEIIVLSLAKGDSIELLNPFETELVNYLQLWLTTTVDNVEKPKLYSFDIDTNQNRLNHIFEKESITDKTHLPAGIVIGKFQGREEAVYTISENGDGVFIFILQGAFEVQYRLLEARDGLALWDVDEIEIEALSNDAIMLLAELTAPQE